MDKGRFIKGKKGWPLPWNSIKNNELIIICSINILFTLTLLTFFCPIYETNDDFLMGVISSGVYGKEYMQYLVFSNILYGYFLKILGLLFGGINWYIVMQYFLLNVAVISLFYMLTHYFPIHIVVYANIIFWYITLWDQIRRIQFTRTAFTLSVCGFALIWSSYKLSKIIFRILGYILCFFGSCIRFECFIIVLAFFFCLELVFCFFAQKTRRKEFRKMLINIVVFICIIGISSFADYVGYSSQEWIYYRQYNKARAQLLDYTLPSWEENSDKYQALGFSQNDLIVLDSWLLADFDKFDYKNLNEIISWRVPPQVTFTQILIYIEDFIGRNYCCPYIYIWMFLIIFMFLHKNCRFFSLMNFGLVLSIYLYLYHIGRIVERVEFGIFLSAISSLIICWLNFYHIKKNCNSPYSYKLIFCILMISVVYLLNNYESKYKDIKESLSEPGHTLEIISQDKDSIYLLDTRSFIGTCFSYSPYRKVPDYYLSNFYFMGSWDTNAPFNNKLIEKLHLTNPMQDLVTKSNVYYVKAASIGGIEMELKYLQENYNENVSATLVNSYHIYNIYQFNLNP